METILLIFVIIVLSLLGLYLIRQAVCWYFKINEQIKLQKQLYTLLVKLLTDSDGNFRKGSNKD